MTEGLKQHLIWATATLMFCILAFGCLVIGIALDDSPKVVPLECEMHITTTNPR
ncbi:MAG: hypothetical protein MRY72_12270 [Aquisalinus sp.]|nr:hypothetical protein [Aquisalinus sp.]